MSARSFFSKDEKEQILNAIKSAEMNTSGEIRVHIEEHCPGEALDSAAYWFHKLKMDETELRNGVLFYLGLKEHIFAIIGDVGINNKVSEDFWENIKEYVLEKFKDGLFVDGLSEGIIMTGEQLKIHFPWQRDDRNELPDELSYG